MLLIKQAFKDIPWSYWLLQAFIAMVVVSGTFMSFFKPFVISFIVTIIFNVVHKKITGTFFFENSAKKTNIY